MPVHQRLLPVRAIIDKSDTAKLEELEKRFAMADVDGQVKAQACLETVVACTSD